MEHEVPWVAKPVLVAQKEPGTPVPLVTGSWNPLRGPLLYFPLRLTAPSSGELL